LSVFSIRAAQEAHVMPPIDSSTVRAGAAGRGSVTGVAVAMTSTSSQGLYCNWVSGKNDARIASAADQSRDGIGRLAYLQVCLGAALLHGLGHAVSEVLLEQLQGERLECLGGGGDLREDVDAVLVLLDHPLQAPDLALDAAQSPEVTVLLLYIARCRAARARVHTTLTGLPLPRITGSMSRIPPSGMQHEASPRVGGGMVLRFRWRPRRAMNHPSFSTALAYCARSAPQPPPPLIESRMPSPPTSRWSRRCSSSTVV